MCVLRNRLSCDAIIDEASAPRRRGLGAAKEQHGSRLHRRHFALVALDRDSFPPGDLPPPEARLYRTMLGLSEVMQAVEIFGQPRVPYAPSPHHRLQEWVGYDAH